VVGGTNLFVEGQADQILLAGLSAHMTRRNESTAGLLDLNEVTIIAAGGADSVPYMVYLARGRPAS
jgi:predicted ATP-dependent endonuclease of OLD family